MRACARASGSMHTETTRRSTSAPLDRAVASGLALADELLEKWQGEWSGDFAPLFRDYAY